jgi:hypothetical protein
MATHFRYPRTIRFAGMLLGCTLAVRAATLSARIPTEDRDKTSFKELIHNRFVHRLEEGVRMKWRVDQSPARVVVAILLAAPFAWGMPAQAETGKTLRMGYILAADSQLGAGATAIETSSGSALAGG